MNRFRVYDDVKIIAEREYYPDLGHIGDGVKIYVDLIRMDRGAQINANTVIAGMGTFTMGKYSTVGYGCKLLTGTDVGYVKNDYAEDYEREVVRGEIHLGDRVFIGSGAVISVSSRNPVIEICDDAIVYSNAYISKSVPSGMKAISYYDWHKDSFEIRYRPRW